jgi:glycosyltransferase involved in cell wall biosynthesis
MSRIPISVIICTHNPRADYFRRTLEALQEQTLAPELWELLIIDNSSTDPLAERVDLRWQPNGRVIREEKLGLTPARLRGIQETFADLLVFVDDDNVLDRDYLDQALRLAHERPWLGAWSGQCRGEFEQPPPEWTKPYWGSLAIREFVEDQWSNLPRLAATMPCGAGLCVRRAAAEYYVQLHEKGMRRIQMDRTGESLLSGGDNDLAACACPMGLGLGIMTALKLTHLIPPQRLTLEYLERLAEGISYSAVILDAEWGMVASPRSLAGLFVDRLRLLKLPHPHRQIAAAAYRGRNKAARQLCSA